MEKTKRNPNVLALGIILSTVMIIMFFLLQIKGNKGLELNYQWLLLSLIPLIIALFVGNYITKLKYGDYEIDSINRQTIDIDSDIIDAIEWINSQQKKSIEELEGLPHKASYKVLRFEYGKKDYYIIRDIIMYLQALPNLRYFEIVENPQRFSYLVKLQDIIGIANVNEIRRNNLINEEIIYDSLGKFINAVQNRSILDAYPHAITDSLTEEDTLLSAYKKLRNLKEDFLPFIDHHQRLIGFVRRIKVESKIAQFYYKYLKSDNGDDIE